nr:hypothetical protein [Tanacetum cinerariifolium]
MAFRDFLNVKTDEDLSFLPKEPSSDFGTGSPSVSINTEPPTKVAEPTGQLVENTTDSRDSSRQEKLVIHSRSVAARIRDQKCRTKGSSKPHVKRRLVQAGFSLRATHRNTYSQADSFFLPFMMMLKNAYACHLKIFAITPPAWRGHLDNQLDAELLDLYDRYYAREKVRDKECEELKAKCEAAMVDFDKKSFVKVLHGKIAALLVEVSLSTLESKVASLKAKKAKLEAIEASLHQEVEIVKLDRAEVVLKVAPYVAMELVQSDYMGKLIAKLVSSAIFFGRCQAFEEVARMKEHTKADNDFATATFPFLSDVIADHYAFVEALLSKKPWILQCLAPTRTHVHHPLLLPKMPFHPLLWCSSRCLLLFRLLLLLLLWSLSHNLLPS